VKINSTPIADTVYRCLYALPPEINTSGTDTTIRDIVLCTYPTEPGLLLLYFKLVALDSCTQASGPNVFAHFLALSQQGDTVYYPAPIQLRPSVEAVSISVGQSQPE